MRTTFKKMFFVWQMDKEEAWLNEMADHGYLLAHAGKFHYDFDEVEAGKYTIKLLMLNGSKHSAKNREYFRFLEDLGIQYADGMNFPGACQVYLKMEKKDAPVDGEFFSDVESKIRYNRVVLRYLSFSFIVILLLAWLNIHMALNRIKFNRMMNGITGGVLCVLCAADLVVIIRLLIQNHHLKKERKIHE